MCIAYVAILPMIIEQLAGAGGMWRAAVAVSLVAPLAVAMGMPFPLGLRSLRGNAARFIPWAWAINGCASVVSAVLAVVLAMHFGFTVVILISAALYAFAAIIARRGLGSRTATAKA